MAELVATKIIASQPTTYSKTDRLRNFTTSLTLFTILKSGNILNENFVFTSITLSWNRVITIYSFVTTPTQLQPNLNIAQM